MWSPGEYLVIHWAQAAPGLFLFCAVLAFSRWRFVRFATDQRASTTLALIAEALAAIVRKPSVRQSGDWRRAERSWPSEFRRTRCRSAPRS